MEKEQRQRDPSMKKGSLENANEALTFTSTTLMVTTGVLVLTNAVLALIMDIKSWRK